MSSNLPSFDALMSNVDKLRDISIDGELSILPYLLSDDEAVKKMISQRNPQLSKDYIDLIVDDEEELLKKDDELEEELSKEDDIESESDETTDSQNEEQLSEEERESRRRQIEERRNIRRREIEDRKKERIQDREKRREKRRDRIREIKKTYQNQLKEFWLEVKDIKNKIVKAVAALYRGIKDIAKDVILNIVQTASSIPGIVTLFSAPPFNVGGAISLTVLVVLGYLASIRKIKEMYPFLEPLRLLPLVTDTKNLSIVSTILNPVVKLLISFWAPIKLLNDAIKSVLEVLKRLFGSNNQNKIFRRATRRLRKLGHIRKGPDIGPPINKLGRGDIIDNIDGVNVYVYDDDDSDEVASLLNQFVLSGDGSRRNHRVVDFKQKFDDQINSLQEEIDSIQIPTEASEEDISRFVYDIRLPDGTVITNISEEGIDYFKKRYTLEYTNFTI